MNWITKFWARIRRKISGTRHVKSIAEDVIYPILSSPGKYIFFCPGCVVNHVIDTTPSKQKRYHTLTGTGDSPTIRASVLYQGENNGSLRCHSFVTDGKIEFLDDCTHQLAGKTVSLMPM